MSGIPDRSRWQKLWCLLGKHRVYFSLERHSLGRHHNVLLKRCWDCDKAKCWWMK